MRDLLLPRTARRAWLGVAIAVAGPLLVTPLIDASAATRRYPTMYYLLIVAVAAGVGRLVAGAIAVVVSAAAFGLWVIERELGAAEAITTVGYVVVAIAIAQLVATLDRSRERSAAAAAAADRATKRLDVIARAGDVLAASLDYEETLRSLGRVVIPDLADWYSVHLVDEEAGAIRQAHVDHLDPSKVELAWELWRTFPPPEPDAPDGVPAVIRTGRSELIGDITDEMLTAALEPLFPDLIPVFRELRLRSVMIVPLRGKDRVFGALQLVSAESGRSYTRQDLEVAEEIAARAAAAIDNALLYRERERVSMALQERLLPKALPRIPGLEAAARYLPAHEWALAGGDFYDIFEMEAGHWKAVIGDVCGTGPAAAALMGFVRFTARAVSRGDVTPSQALRKLNAALLEEIGPGSVDFCTCAIVRIVPHGGGARLVVAVGGHPLPLVVHPDGVVEEVGTPGTLLGVLEDVDVADTFAELAPGDTAILLTDGVLEASRDEHAEAAIHELLAPIAGLHPESVADIVEATVIGTEDRRPDDVAVIVLRAPLDAPPEGYRAREGLPGLLLFDAKGRWVDANLRVLADLGARRDQVVGARLDDLVVEPQDVATELEAYLAEGTWSGEVTLRRPDGTTVRYRNESRLLSAARRGPVHLSRLMPLG